MNSTSHMMLRFPTMSITLKGWWDFKRLASNSKLLIFDIEEDGTLRIQSVNFPSTIFIYHCKLPDMATMVRCWLSQTLQIPPQNIIQGEIEIPFKNQLIFSQEEIHKEIIKKNFRLKEINQKLKNIMRKGNHKNE